MSQHIATFLVLVVAWLLVCLLIAPPDPSSPGLEPDALALGFSLAVLLTAL